MGQKLGLEGGLGPIKVPVQGVPRRLDGRDTKKRDRRIWLGLGVKIKFICGKKVFQERSTLVKPGTKSFKM